MATLLETSRKYHISWKLYERDSSKSIPFAYQMDVYYRNIKKILHNHHFDEGKIKLE